MNVVAKKQDTNPLMELPTGVDLDMLRADSGAGSENVTAKDTAIPLISILQGNSPQCKRSDPKYIDGAKEGDLYNNVTEEVYDGQSGVVMVPCHFEKVYIEWRPNRGGFVAIHDAETELKNQTKMVATPEGKEVPTLPNGNSLTETNQHYVLILRTDGAFEPAVVPMSSSALKASRLWNTLIKRVVLKDTKDNLFNPASYYMTYRITTKPVQKGANSWCTWAIETNAPVNNRSVYDTGRALHEAVKGGQVRVKQEPVDAHEPVGAKDDDIPLDIL